MLLRGGAREHQPLDPTHVAPHDVTEIELLQQLTQYLHVTHDSDHGPVGCVGRLRQDLRQDLDERLRVAVCQQAAVVARAQPHSDPRGIREHQLGRGTRIATAHAGQDKVAQQRRAAAAALRY